MSLHRKAAITAEDPSRDRAMATMSNGADSLDVITARLCELEALFQTAHDLCCVMTSDPVRALCLLTVGRRLADELSADTGSVAISLREAADRLYAGASQ